ncbi:MAG: hypothetical protein QGH85_00505 [Candidatus Pacebacteria bacterium]|jgi:hypothetical protein|nr:hypothetical protein [Candidatus Paceibacterota bacterium]MDP7159054.1 hypothetical protein [Candidatus Paceibacterota bacterium]MDP7366612.1 hypothetical protein [Candidatus Paceibacterota bacterium]MDP7466104.1 hypothetical protein [Candidatus Paceibacterota bacterium]MDP7648198.1 hypothetical protein [Candidatus Paceibacterota bacterium]|tara:strand:- start:729 stop:857 length:129 start_codon:yes stop_codon:yes gene_type:complete
MKRRKFVEKENNETKEAKVVVGLCFIALMNHLALERKLGKKI